ncbi:hypothetical protein WJ0W_000758 [Paenibacillus melissococcoides]|uniref:Uncharacterized protein n=1 Tax=Paenibacillus melissococcoides TaxID=2912268 RepID=A0ABN8U1X1_9BACL|nr:hypothetical protein WJ0W_000758 [Paenibacillus melissococcoides]
MRRLRRGLELHIAGALPEAAFLLVEEKSAILKREARRMIGSLAVPSNLPTMSKPMLLPRHAGATSLVHITLRNPRYIVHERYAFFVFPILPKDKEVT